MICGKVLKNNTVLHVHLSHHLERNHSDFKAKPPVFVVNVVVAFHCEDNVMHASKEILTFKQIMVLPASRGRNRQ